MKWKNHNTKIETNKRKRQKQEKLRENTKIKGHSPKRKTEKWQKMGS